MSGQHLPGCLADEDHSRAADPGVEGPQTQGPPARPPPCSPSDHPTFSRGAIQPRGTVSTHRLSGGQSHRASSAGLATHPGPLGEPGALGWTSGERQGAGGGWQWVAAGSYLCEMMVGGSCLWSPARMHFLAFSSGTQQLASRAWAHSSMTTTSKWPSGNSFRGPSEEAPGYKGKREPFQRRWLCRTNRDTRDEPLSRLVLPSGCAHCVCILDSTGERHSRTHSSTRLRLSARGLCPRHGPLRCLHHQNQSPLGARTPNPWKVGICLDITSALFF